MPPPAGAPAPRPVSGAREPPASGRELKGGIYVEKLVEKPLL